MAAPVSSAQVAAGAFILPAVFIVAGMVEENRVKVAGAVMALGIGLHLIPLGVIAWPEVLDLSHHPFEALVAFVVIGAGLAGVSFGLSARRNIVWRLLAAIAGFALLLAPQLFGF